MVSTLSEFNFGDYEGRREFLRSSSYFLDSFAEPLSFSLDTLKASKNFILVGRKGSGKTACQLFLQEQLKKKSYTCSEIVFYRDIESADYPEFAKSQTSIIDITKITPGTDISFLYDFRSVWKRTILINLAKSLKRDGKENNFTRFCLATTKGTNSIIDGILKGLQVEINVPLGPIGGGKIAFDPSKLSGGKISISEFNATAQSLFKEECKNLKAYLFIDELVVSTLNTQGDEYRLRIALIRDLTKVSAELNDFFVANEIDFNIVLLMRPEIRHRVNQMDAEIGKILDGNEFLHWDLPGSSVHPLINIMHEKIKEGSPSEVSVNLDTFLVKSITFGNTNTEIGRFFLNNSWYRPRDMVRYLKSLAKMCPNETSMTERAIKVSLNEYARVSAKEIIDELSVMLPEAFIGSLGRNISRKVYDDLDMFARAIGYDEKLGISEAEIGQSLFELGLIGNIGNGERYFSAHRQEEELKPHRKIQIHPGLWNYFNIR